MVTKYLKATEVAEYFIEKAYSENDKITRKKLQKMLYYAQAWFLVVNKRKLFEEKIEAWLHGPAIYSIYQEYKSFGFLPIKKEIDKSLISKIDEKQKGFLNQIWKIYGKYDADYLEILSHNEEPWQKARIGVAKFSASRNEISTTIMKKFYSDLLLKSQGSNG